MALQPNQYQGKERLQPGARGEIFQANLPGYRAGEDRINRTNTKINTNSHDVPNIKYMLDDRLPVLFRYGYAFGYNQIVVPKGRIMAIDPTMNQFDFEMKKQYNTVTLANGGVNVELDPSNPKEWISTSDSLSVDPDTGLPIVNGAVSKKHRFANIPIGIIERNEYTRDVDAHNGYIVGPILTDAMIELPWFAEEATAKGNPWGSAYGSLKPGDLVKSDTNGRFVRSPLSDPVALASMDVATLEHERQQIVGQIYETNKELVPAGAAKYAQWALSDILKFEGFNPDVYRQNNRRGEDNINNSPFNSTGNYPGYPYDKAYMNDDLHMLESYRGTYDQRLQDEYRFDHGIPGLTDGYNAVVKPYTDRNVGSFSSRGANDEYVDIYVRANEVAIDQGTLQIALGDTMFAPCTVGATLTATVTVTDALGASNTVTGDIATVKYANELQGLVVLSVIKAAADTFFTTAVDEHGIPVQVPVSFSYTKRGEAGVPTFLDWDGCMGSVKILLQK